jgi:hypothetical protein
MVTVTERWETEVLAECLRCGEAMAISPVLMGVELGPGRYLCHPCYFGTYHGSKAAALAALGPSDDDPDGGPAAPAARSTLWLIVNGQSVPRELSPDEERELAEFIAACAETAPLPEPCIQCGRPASPFETTPDGVVCWRCWGPTPPAPSPSPAEPAVTLVLV